LSDFSHEFRYGERIGILGKNGVGKSTFLNILVGDEPFDTGRREVAENVQFGYYSQQIVFPPHVKVLEYAKSIADWMMIGKDKISATKLLERFLFSPAQQQSRVHDLSGGEKRRLYLLTTLMKKPNFLILDEPTNDLDIETMNALEDFLLSYT
jgi:ABC transport system ATP-binding/permease protein